MIKRIIVFLLVLLLFVTLTSCGEKKILHCDNCNVEVKVDADSNMEEDWSIFCAECNEKLFGDMTIE